MTCTSVMYDLKGCVTNAIYRVTQKKRSSPKLE